jgi:hypothetical protein
MSSVARNQLTLDFEPSLPERFSTLRSYIAHRAMVTSKALKVQAADMDLSPSTLTRKLNPAEGDTQRFNLDDLEDWITSTGECAAVIEYLAAKFMDSDDARRVRALARVEQLGSELASVLAALKQTGQGQGAAA